MKKHFDTVITFTGESAESFSRILQGAYRTPDSQKKLSQMLRDGDALRTKSGTNR